MKLTVLHLSDLHIKSPDNLVLKIGKAIASTTYGFVHNADACLIAVTGDIANAGLESEYTLARNFFGEIREQIKQESRKTVDSIFVPGNHDCNLKMADGTRSVLIESVVREPNIAEDISVIKNCVAPQRDFFAFRNQFTSLTPIYDDELWTEYEIEMAGEKCRISALNVAWMSRNPEPSGTLVFPMKNYGNLIAQPCDLRLSLIHHPLNWYTQTSYHPLRKTLKSYSNAILSGHEHTPEVSKVIGSDSDCLLFEAPALEPHTGEERGFTIMQFDTARKEVLIARYSITAALKIRQMGDNTIFIWRRADYQGPAIEINTKFENVLRDAGGNFNHPEKPHLELDDIYVYPHVKKLTTRGIEEPEAAEQFTRVTENSYTLLLGEDKSGKTTLLRRLFSELHLRHKVPLLINATSFSSVSEDELARQLQRYAKEQYSDHSIVDQSHKADKVALIDDIDRLPGGSKRLPSLVNFFEQHFGAIVVTAHTGFEITELLHTEASNVLKKYSSFELLRFGHRLRRELVRKWCMCGNISTKEELDKRLHVIEDVLNSVVGRNLVPAYPIYLLILLQSYESNQQADLQHTSFAHYYAYLINKSLAEAGVKQTQMNEIYNYLSNLAWFLRTSNIQQASLVQLRQFNTAFSEGFTSVDLTSRLSVLCKARILQQISDDYQFTYQYIYFFFLGKYLADHLEEDNIKTAVREWCSNLQRRENAHAILFLTHHRNSDWVIEQIATVLHSCFEQTPAMKMEEDIAAVNSLIAKTTDLIISETNVEENQDRLRAERDEMERDEERAEHNNEIEKKNMAFIDKVNLLLRTADVLGQVLKNNYGSLRRPQKNNLLKEVFNGPLRLLHSVFEILASDPEALAAEIEVILKNEYPEIKPDKVRDVAHKLTFNLLGGISTSLIVRAANAINIESLREDIAKVVSDSGTIAYRLIEAATLLLKPGHVNTDSIKIFAKEIEGNILSFRMLQSLGASHLYLYHTSDMDKQKLCDALSLKMKKARKVDSRGRRTKALKSPHSS